MAAHISELEGYYRFIRPSDLLGKYTLTSFKDKSLSSDKTFISELTGFLIGTGEGIRKYGIPTLSEIVTKVNTLQGKAGEQASIIPDIIRVYSDGEKIKGSEDQWKDDFGGPGNWSAVIGSDQSTSIPKLGVIQSASPFLNQNVRDIDKIAFFMNTIPTIELSRAIPFLDVQFQFSRPQDVDEKRLRVPSLLKFLNGAIDPTKYAADNKIFQASIDKQIGIDKKQKQVFRSGMELFTSPQTLFNPSSEGTTAVRFVPVIDKTRPFMSIDQFEVTAAPTTGLFSYKTAKLNLILHDRSRLAEISDLVRPEVYSNTTLSISYGWSHPDGDESNNVYGQLLNSMAVHNEKYGIVNCSFAFDQVGQVKITLQLAMKGTQELRVVKIIESEEFESEIKLLDRLTAQIASLREASGFSRPEGFQKEVRAYQILEVAERGELTAKLKSEDVTELITKLKNKTGSTADAAGKLADALKQLFVTDGSQKSLKDKLAATIDGAINKKFDLLTEGEDPFLPRETDGVVGKRISAVQHTKFEKGKKKSKKVCSLAKIFLTFVGIPLQSIQNVNEIQFMFYQFNGNAGDLGNSNIGSFPVEISYLKDVFKDHVTTKNNPAITLNEFMMLLQSAVISDPRAFGYGLREQYQSRSDISKEPELIKNSKIENVLSSLFEKHGTFKFPVVEAYIETNGGRPFQEGELVSQKDQLDIMRIHIYDKTASPYEPMLQLLKSQTGLQEVINQTKTLGDQKNNEKTKALLVSAIESANTAGLNLKQDPETGKITIVAPSNVQNMKDFIAQVLPTITYGSNHTALASANLSTQQNQSLSTVQMLRSAKQNNAEPNGSSQGGIPLRTIPAQLDLNVHGCPLLNINQQFFVDFKTGTTIDNIYLLTHLTHTIKAGKFESHAKLVPLDAYGVYESIIAKVNQLSDSLKDLANSAK